MNAGKRRMPRIAAVVGMAAAAVTGCSIVIAQPSEGHGVSAPASPASALAEGRQDTAATDMAAEVEPGVVIINAGLQYDGEAAAGTGIVLNARGLVLTNNHVIEDSTSVTATVPATGKTYTARVLGYDKSGDIALIQLKGASGLAGVPVGNSSAVKVGQTVIALGNAGGQNIIRTAAGNVTGLGETITASDDASSTGSETLHGMIQTNADIAPGDSGGPLASSAGVIGMDTAGSDADNGQQAIGFAIPINTALLVAREIAAGRAGGVVATGYPPFLGVILGSGSDGNPQDQAPQEQPPYGFSGSGSCSVSDVDISAPSAIAPVNSGVLVDGTLCGSPAARAGMTGGAVITAVNGQAVTSPDGLSRVLAPFHPGDTVSVTWVSPSGQEATSSIRLAAGPPA